MDQITLVAQAACVLFLALWLTSGVLDNILYPQMNETFTAEVMQMTRLRDEYPEAYALVAHRSISNRSAQRAAFRLVVIWELLATIALWAAATALVMAVFSILAADTARALALVAALMFTTTWALFLVVGNHFSYWFGHEGAQNTHFQMTLWGIGTMIFLTA